MSFVRTFVDFTPPSRFDGADPFTEALIEESANADGPFALLETIALDPVDDKPASPRSRNLTTDRAKLDPAWYRITWRDASGDEFTGDPVLFPSLPRWAPTIGEVASYIRARTKIAGGGIAGTFTDQTNIKASEVEPLILQAVRRVQSEVGSDPCTDELRADGRTVAAIYAAMLVEQSFFPEQTTGAGNSFASLEKLFKPQLQTLANRVQRECGTGSGGEDGSEGAAISRANFDDRTLIGPNGPLW